MFSVNPAGIVDAHSGAFRNALGADALTVTNQLSAASAVISGDASVAGLTVTAAADVAGAVDLGAADSAPGANDGADVTARRHLAVAGELTAARGVVGTATFYQGGGAVFQSDQAVTMQTAAGGGVWSARHNGVTMLGPADRPWQFHHG